MYQVTQRLLGSWEIISYESPEINKIKCKSFYFPFLKIIFPFLQPRPQLGELSNPQRVKNKPISGINYGQYCAAITTVCFRNSFIAPNRDFAHLAPPSPQPVGTSNLLSVSVSLPVTDISCQWNYAIVVLLCLVVSLSIMCSRSIHVMTYMRILFLFVAE